MAVNVEALGTLERRLQMSLPMSQLEHEVGERLKKLARNVKMPGFRPGKVPMKIVEQTYGAQVRNEVTGDAVQKAFTDAVKQANLKVAGYPRIEPKKDAPPKDALEFSATFEVYPEFKVGELAGASIERPQVEVDDAGSTRPSRSCAAHAFERRAAGADGDGSPDFRNDRRQPFREASQRLPFALARAACCPSSKAPRAAWRRGSRRPSS
jgi:hypothetical protein